MMMPTVSSCFSHFFYDLNNALTLYLPKKSYKENDSNKIQDFIIYIFFKIFIKIIYMNAIKPLVGIKHFKVCHP